MKAITTLIGNVTTATSAERTWRRKTTQMRATITASSINVSRTVVDGPLDQRAPVVDRAHDDSGGRPWLHAAIFALTRAMVASAFSPNRR
ncbi:MAG: hypothetical protein IPN47_23135 [Gemmatimonadetes bacterium]|nr:hypothetical protein [Gemmatimonadota bacterium]